jgi:hypothetical protein
MVFRRKKNKSANNEVPAGMRGRDKIDAHASDGSQPGRNPLARRFQSDDEPETIDLVEPARFQDAETESVDEDITRVLVGAAADEDDAAEDSLEDPVAGFLVIINGPGRGHVAHVGYGLNSIGREPSQRIALDFGDRGISRESHCLVTFDPVAGKFYVQAGEGRNLAYLKDEPVLVPVELESGDHIRLGSTELRFLPLCGDGFGWD